MSGDAPARHERLVHAAMTLLMFLCFLRAMFEHDPTPYWTHDPFRFAPPITGLSLGWATLFNAALILLSGVVLTWVPVPKPVLLLVLTATGFAISGVWILGAPEDVLGTSNAFVLVSVVTSASGYFSVYPALLKPVLGYTLGFLCFLLAEGTHQYFIQHPLTVEYYESTKDTFLAARGWEPGSFQALSYERRLRQPEMLGWVQLSNVFAAMMGAGALGCAVVARRSGRAARTVLGILAAMFSGALLISGSKGAIGVTLLSLIAFAVTLVPKLRVARGAALAAGGAIVIAGVVAGSQLGQLSLIFRTQYIRGAFSTLVHGAPIPIFGTSPARFQELYQAHKPPDAPEDVTSAHNVLVDLVAYFGAGGLMLVGVLLVLVFSARESEERDQNENGPSWATDTARISRVLSVLALLSVALCLRMMTGVLTPDRVAFLSAGALAWIGVIVLVCRSPSRFRDVSDAIFAIGSVLALHALFDLGTASVVSTPVFAMLIGAALRRPATSGRNPRPIGPGLVVTGLLIVPVSVFLILNDGILREHGARAAPFAAVHERLGLVPVEQSGLPELLRLEPGPDDDPYALLLSHELRVRREIGGRLSSAFKRTGDWRMLHASAEQELILLRAQTSPDPERFARSLRWTADQLDKGATSAGDLVLAGRIELELRRAGYPRPSDVPEDLILGRWTRADRMTPHDPQSALRLMEYTHAVGMQGLAARYARAAIERSDRMALDPLKQLPEDQLERARSVLNGAP